MKISFFLILVFIFNGLSAQFDDDFADAYFDVLEQNDKFSGSVAIAKDGKIIYRRAIGYSDFENRKKNDSETAFRIGSISKTFTATMIMKAVEEEKINLNQTIDKYFPTLKNADKITVEMLLSHRSGIFNITADPTYLTWNTEPKTEKELVKMISDYDSNFEPGTEFKYSNSNYILLSFVLEKIYKKPYSKILEELIIKPLNLKHTFFKDKIDGSKNEAFSYKYNGNWIKSPVTDMSIPLGAGGISSTPTDLILFAEALFGGKIVSKESLEKMETMKDGYGFGLFKMPFYDKTAFGHNGGIDNFSSSLVYFPNEKIAFSMVSNGSDFNENDISIAMLNLAFGNEIKLPVIKKSEGEVIPGYTGSFSNGQIGMTIEITENDGKYFAQASGQSAFPLEKISDTEFRFDLAGIVILFNPDLKSFTLQQGGGEFIFVKE